MRSVAVMWHVVDPAVPIEMPIDELRAAFAAAGIDLLFQKGEDFRDFDPAHYANRSYQALVDELRQRAATIRSLRVGHLILGLGHKTYQEEIAGELLDLDSRGVAVVYRYCDYIRQGGHAALLQTCAHEIGHMLNLAHEDIARDFPTIMDQANQRYGDIHTAWQLAAAEAQSDEARGHPSYLYEPLPIEFPCYPFAYAARARLNTRALSHVLPWRSRYDRPYDGAEDRLHVRPELSVEPEHNQYVQGGVFTFKVSVRNTGNRPILLPSLIGSQYDNLICAITRPDGGKYQHRPRTLACSHGNTVLAPGSSFDQYLCTIRGPGGAVFPDAGSYSIQVSLPCAQLSSVPVDVEVERRTKGFLTSPAFRKSIALGAALSPSLRRRVNGEIASKRNIEPQTRAYLALIASRSIQDRQRARSYTSIALSSSAPTEVRHAAIADELDRLCSQGGSERKAMRELLTRHLGNPSDEHHRARLEKRFAL